MSYLDNSHAELLPAIAEKKELDDDLKEKLDAALEQFLGVFAA
jgi:F0F1-type ATP synthase alpha subunit